MAWGDGSLYRRRDGRWCGQLSVGGRRLYVYGRTRREAAQKLAALRERSQAGALAPPGRVSLRAWADMWLALGEGRWRPTTARRTRQALSPLLERLGRAPLSRLAPPAIAWALADMLAAGVGSRTAQLALAALRACLNDAERMGLIPSNPCQRVPRPKHERGEGKGWGLQEMRAFLGACLEDGRPLASMLALMLLTGLRPGEAMGLQWGDIDLEHGTLTVRRSVTWAGSAWHLGRPKSKAGERTIALPSLALAVLGRLPRESVYLFWQERPPTPQAVSGAMARLCQRANVPRRPAHYLRHAHASLLAAQGLDVKSLQRRLGHAQASLTLDVYAHALSEMDRRAAELVDGALG